MLNQHKCAFVVSSHKVNAHTVTPTLGDDNCEMTDVYKSDTTL